MSLYYLGFTLGAGGAWFVMTFGSQLGIDDAPNQRSSHTEIVPKGGGIGILLTVLTTSWILSIPPGLWIPAFTISIVSFWGGDKHRLTPLQRLFVHFLCSIVFIISLFYERGLSPALLAGILPISIFIVGTSNFFNFMDGIDGIAGISGAIAFLLIAFYSEMIGGVRTYTVFSIVLAFACAGFLCFNLPKAKVFLGDIGSILIGFLFACLVTTISSDLLDFFVMAGFLSTFYFDELFTMAVRIQKGNSLIKAHRKHIYQLLVNEFSICHWKISVLYGIIQLSIGLTLIYASTKGFILLLILYLMYCSIFIAFGLKVYKKALIRCE